MDHYKEFLLVVYDIVMKDERQYAMEKGLSFDTDAYFLEAFSEDEVRVLAPMIATKVEKGKGRSARRDRHLLQGQS